MMIPQQSAPFDQVQLRTAFGHFPSGVTALCATVDGQPVGMAASSFTSVSIDPPLVSICIAGNSTTWPTLRSVPRLGVSVLAQGQAGIGRQLASKVGDRFASLEWAVSEDGALFVEEACLWLDCTVHQIVPAGDHVIVLFEIRGITTFGGREPLVFHGSRFRQLALEG